MVLVVSIAVLPACATEKIDAKTETKSTILQTEKDQKTLCKKVAVLIKNNKIDEYMPERKDFDPRGSRYLNLDIDDDGIPDKVEVSSGSEGSYLAVKLSTGGKYALDEDGFIKLIRFEGNIYAVVTYREWNEAKDNSKIIGYRVYKLTKDAAIIVCDNI